MLIFYIAILLVMAVLNLFLAFIIRQTVNITNRQVQAHFSRQLAKSAEALDGKLDELSDVEKQLEAAKEELEIYRRKLNEEKKTASTSAGIRQTQTGTGGLFYQSGIDYRSTDALEAHSYIRNHMKLDYGKLVDAALELRRDPGHDWEVCGRILEKIDFETLFELMSSDEDRSAKRLGELLDAEELEVFERIAPAQDGADFAKRIDRVRQYRKMHDPTVRLRTGDINQTKPEGRDVVIEYDPGIHDGIRLRVGDGMLDYSL